MRIPPACLAALVAVALPTAARAQVHPPAAPDGTVVAIDVGELVVDLGAPKGVKEGDLLELWRPLRLRHPVTNQVLVDRFRIGSLRLVQVRSALSLAIVEGPLARPPAIGDVLVMPAEARAPRAAPPLPGVVTPVAPLPAVAAPIGGPAPVGGPGPVAQAKPAVEVDADAQALGDLMSALTGTDPETRARGYRSFVAAHPRSRFSRVLREEIVALRGSKAVERSAERKYEWSAPTFDRVRAGEPQRFAVELDSQFVGAVVHVRKKGAPGFRSVPLQNIGPRYWSGVLPGDAMTDGGMEYFVEGVPSERPAVTVLGSAEAPLVVDVDAPPGVPRPPGTLAQVSMQSEYASFNVKRPNDYVWQTEGSAGWRLGDVGVRAVRSGFGVLRGEGGTLRDLDELGKPPTSVGLTYGYVESELAFTPTASVIVRPILGLRESGVTGGAQGFVRIGNDLRTNLSLGGEVLGSVGQRGIVHLDWRTIKRVPIALRTEITNQPASSSDVGARAIVQVGYQLTSELALAARVSYQGRTINHAGPGAGLAASYQW